MNNARVGKIVRQELLSNAHVLRVELPGRVFACPILMFAQPNTIIWLPFDRNLATFSSVPVAHMEQGLCTCQQ